MTLNGVLGSGLSKRRDYRRFVFMLLLLFMASSLFLLADGTVYNPRTGGIYPSIQSAINQSVPYDRIIVGPGLYDESLRISHSLNLQGVLEDGKMPILAPSYPNAPAISVTNPPYGSDVTVEGFEINVDVIQGYGLLAEVCNFTLRNNRINGNGQGLAVKTYLPTGLYIMDNVFTNFWRGIAVENPPERPIYNVAIRGNSFLELMESILLV